MSAERRPARPSRSLLGECLVAGVLACVATAGAATMLGAALRLGPWYPRHTVMLVGGVMAVAASRIRSHHPWPHFGPANAVTSSRLVLVGLVGGLWEEPASPDVAHAAALMGLAGVTLDGVDGFLARRTRMTSGFGARFDMEVDALLILALAALVHHTGKAGPWVLASGLLRYGFVAAGWVWPWLARPLAYSRRRQAVCVLQIAGLLLALDPMTGARAGAWLSAIALGALTWSFAVDVLELRAQR